MAQILLLLAVGLGLSVAQYAQTDADTAYTPGREFVYRYESQVVNGLPDPSRVFSIYKVICNAKIQCKTATKCLLVLEDAEIYKKNARMEAVDPTRTQIPPNLLEPVTGAEAQTVIEQLKKPIIFKYDRGLVQDILTAPDEPYWSINFKRGVVNMFQMNLDGRRALPISAAPVSMPAVYKVMESCPLGVCETVYEVQATSVETGHAAIAVKKTRNYKNCVETPYFVIDSMNAEECVGCAQQKPEAMTPSVHITAILLGTKTDFIVESAVAENRFTVLPYGRLSTPIVACTNQSIKLIKSGPAQMVIPEPRGVISQPGGLKAYIPERAVVEAQLTIPGLHQYAPEQWQPITEISLAEAAHAQPDQGKIEMAGKILATLASLVDESGPKLKDAPTYMRLLIETLRNCSSAEMQEIVRKWGTVQAGEAVSGKTAKMLLVTIASLSGTYPAVETICNAVVAGHIPPALAVCVFPKIGHTAIATPVVAKKLMETAQSTPIKGWQNVKQSAWLATAAVIHRMAKTEREWEEQRQQAKAKIAAIVSHIGGDAGLERLQSRIERRASKAKQNCQAVKTEFIKNIKAILEGPVKSRDMLMAIKAIGNSGLCEFLPELVAKAMDTTTPVIIRAQAVYAMRRIAKVAPEKVLEAVLPIYMDMREDEQVRVACFVIAVACKPSFAVWQMVANSLKWETNNQVGSFVYSYLEHMSNSTYPCACDNAMNATLALYQAKAIRKGLWYSQAIHMPSNFESLNGAVAMDAWYVGSRASWIPQAASIKYRATAAGWDFAPIEIGWNSQGMEAVISQLAGQMTSVLDKLKNRPPKRGYSPGEDVINAIKENLNIASDEVDEPQADVYIKTFGDTMHFYVLDKTALNEIINNAPAVISTGIAIDAKAAFNLAETQVMAPTEAGMICRLHITTPAIMGAEGRVSVQTKPDISRAIRQIQTPEQVDIDAEIKPVYVKEMFAHVSVDALSRQAGVATRVLSMAGDVTVKAIASVNIKTRKASAKLDAPTETKDVLKVETVTVSYIRKLPYVCGAGMVPLADEAEITQEGNARVVPVNVKWGRRACGIELNAVGQYARSYISMRGTPGLVSSTAFCPFIGKNMMTIRAGPGDNPVTSIEIQSACGWPKPTQAVSSGKVNSWASKLNPLSALWSNTASEQAEETEIGMIDLDSSALFTSDVARRLQMREVDDADQASYAITVLGNGGAVKRAIQSEILWQRKANGKQHNIAVVVKRTPIPGVETEPWQAEAQIVVEDDRQTVGVQKILSSGHQRAITEQLNQLDCKACAEAIQALIGQDEVTFQKMVASKSSFVGQPAANQRIQQIIKKQVEIAKQILHVKSVVEQEVPAETVIAHVETALAACKSIVQEIQHIIATECGQGEASTRGSSCSYCAEQIQIAQAAIQQAAVLASIEPIIRYAEQVAAESQHTIFSWAHPSQQAQELREQHEQQIVAAIQATDALIMAVEQHQSCERLVSNVATQQGSQVTASCRIAWGPQDRPKENQIIVEAAVKKSPVQLVFEKQQVDPSTCDPAIREMAQGSGISEPQMLERIQQIELEANTLRSMVVKMDATRARIPEAVHTATVQTQECLKSRWYSNSWVTRSAAAVTPAGKAMMTINLWKNGRKFDAVLATPVEEVSFVGIPMGIPMHWCGMMIPNAASQSVWSPSFIESISAVTKPSDICVVQGARVQTFDGAAFHLNLQAVQECQKLLAMDCSAKKAFAVVIKESPSEKVVVVAARQDKVEVVIPITASQPPHVIVNGKITDVPAGSSIFTEEEAQVEAAQQVGLQVINHGAGLIEVKAIQEGVSVQACKQHIAVKATPSLRSKICGLCGNYDGEESNEFTTPQKQLVPSAQAFQASYLVPSQQCDAEKIQAAQISAKSAAVCIPVKKNAVIVQGNKVCISKEPQDACPVGCVSKREATISVPFHCLDARTAAAKQLQEQAERRVLRELINKTTDTHKPVSVPVQCAPAH